MGKLPTWKLSHGEREGSAVLLVWVGENALTFGLSFSISCLGDRGMSKWNHISSSKRDSWETSVIEKIECWV